MSCLKSVVREPGADGMANAARHGWGRVSVETVLPPEGGASRFGAGQERSNCAIPWLNEPRIAERYPRELQKRG
jgi:hypothetical protein